MARQARRARAKRRLARRAASSSTSPTRSAIPSLADVDTVARSLGTDASSGLTASEAARRLAADGANVLRAAAPVQWWQRALAQLRDPLVRLLLVAIAVALAAWVYEGSQGWPVDAVVIAAIVILDAALGVAQEARAASAVEALARMSAVTSTVLRDGALVRIASDAIVRGDVLVLAEGDSVGADARLAVTTSLRMQESSLTGESEPVPKDATTLAAAAAIADRSDMVWKGTAVVQGSARAIVTATGMRTEIGAIAAMLDTTAKPPTPLQADIARIGRRLGVAVVAIAVVVVAAVLLLSEIQSASDVVAVLLLGVSIAVAAVPEGLPAILSVVLAIGVQRMARRNAIVKLFASVETLGSASVICSDKTGTLTRSEMTIERAATASGASRMTGVGYAPLGRVEHDLRVLAAGPVHAEHVVLLGGGSLAGNAGLHERDGAWEIQGDPTEAAFLVAERKLGTAARRQRRFERMREIPFSSERKMMSTIERDLEHGGALVLVAKGAPDVLIGRCTRIRVGMDVLPFDAASRQRVLAEVDRFSDAALRTLAVAYRPLAADDDTSAADESLERDLVFVGTVGIIDPPRPEVAAAIREARRAGIRVVMITGDHPRTAARIAADLGIVAPGTSAITGAQLDALEGEAFAAAVQRAAVIARVAPAHKLRIVEALRAGGDVVAMTGDGVNDAPALKAADIGVAMGIAGTEVSKEAANMILADDNFATIVAAVREGRAIYANIGKILRYLLSSNLGEVLAVFLGVVGASVLGLRSEHDSLALPLLTTQILWINLVTDGAPALALGVDPEADDVMARPPRRRDANTLDARTWWEIATTGATMALATLLSIDFFLPGGLIEGAGGLDRARTAGFTVLVIAQLFNCLNARSEMTSAFRGAFANRWLWLAIAASAALQVAAVHLPVFNVAFATVPLTLREWLICIAMASSVFWVGELRKALLRRAASRARRRERCEATAGADAGRR
jgi:magnesium-transporting ATPase (P-type)